MVYSESKISVGDNSGALMVGCIKVLRGRYGKCAYLSDRILVSIKTIRSTFSKVSRKQVLQAILIRTKKATRRIDGSFIKFDKNQVVLINNDGAPKGTRVFGALPLELRKTGYLKLVSVTTVVL